MEKEKNLRDIIVNVSEHETRIAILEEAKLVELLVERPEKERMVGDIYKGIVRNVLPGMQAAFIDIGLGKTAFLHLSDITELFDVDYLEEEEELPKGKKKKKFDKRIQDILKKDQEILVQVIKEPMGTKGARVTSQISLPGRYVVFVPGENHIGVSKRISNWQEKRRLKKLVSEVKPEGVGLIVRTAAEGKQKKEFQSDIRTFSKTWERIKKQAEKREAPSLIHKDIELVSSIVRDVLSPEVGEVVVDSKGEFKSIISYLKQVAPSLRSKVRPYTENIPLFDLYGIESEIEKMLERKVWIKKGAYIIIDQTEAMVTIDVNTGRYVGKTTQEETILKTNLEAAKEIARQIRLRDIGGLIIVDFIDMEKEENRKKVYDEFRRAFRNDRSKSSILPISEFGLIQMTRERIRPSLMHTFSEPCPTCRGVGRVLSKETLATKIERWFKRARIGSSHRDYRLVVSPQLAQVLANQQGSRLKRLSRELRLNIELLEEPHFRVDQYQIFSLEEGIEVTDRFKT
jgi:ribonuclease G